MVVAVDANVKDQINSMIESSYDGKIVAKCTVCGKENKGKDARKDMRRHIETHIEGVSYPCNQCGKVSRSSNALNTHISNFHRN